MSPPRMATVVAQNTALTFLGYLAVGLEAAIVPIYIDSGLALGATLAGVALSAQPLATLASRASTGRFTDRFGARLTVVRGLLLIALSGLLFSAAAVSAQVPRPVRYAVLLLSRMMLGWGVSWVSAAGAVWAISRAGDEHTSKVFVWNGVATYGSLALGAPIGLWIALHGSTATLGWLIAALGLLAAAGISRIADIEKVATAPLRLYTVLRRVMPFGSVLALATSGYGVFAAFISLYFQSHGWHDAALPLTLYGVASVAVRLLLGRWIDRYSVYRVGLLSIAVELGGLALLASSHSEAAALAASCLLGAGFSLVFPALSVPTVLCVGPRDRASAISVYTGFMEISLTITAPTAGVLITHSGFRPAFWMGFLIVLTGFGGLWLIWHRRKTVE